MGDIKQEKCQDRGAGLKLKLLLLQEGGGVNFHFMSCAFALNCKLKQFHMHCKTGNVLSVLNVLRKCEVYIKKMSSHFRLMLPDFLVLAKELICVIKFL